MNTITNSIIADNTTAITIPDDFDKSGMNFRSQNPLEGFEATIASYDNDKSLAQLIKYNDEQTHFQFPALKNGIKTNDGIFYEIAVLTVSRSDAGQIAVYKCVVDKPKNRALVGKGYFIRDTKKEEAAVSSRNPIVLAVHSILSTTNSLKGQTRSKPKQPSKTPKKATKEDTVERIKLELADKDNREVIPGLSAAVGSGEIEKHEFNGSNLSLRIASKSNSPHTRNTKFDLSISDRIGSPHENEEGKLSDRRLSAKLHATVVEGRNEGQAEDYILSSSNVKLSSWKEAKFTIPKLLKRFLFQKELELPK
ncbi:MAG: hypothetical protein HOA17_01980 [Candidatus Melainabacteria bacterium]|jgi:hypothetical protein|nr:hypothetical protein [Candidatus Melainabacteria bacterium]